MCANTDLLKMIADILLGDSTVLCVCMWGGGGDNCKLMVIKYRRLHHR
jgi:hypothetical protein